MPFPHITIRGDQMGGAPCIRGLRIPVSVVLDMIAEGMTPHEILELHPDLQAEDIPEVLRFAAEAVRERAEANRYSSAHIDESGERPVISGTNIKVSLVASEFEHAKMTPDEIVEAHPHLTLADVHAALMFYYDHMQAIRQDWADASHLIESLRARFTSRLTAHTR
jgi:uncharacterized protein (DUF433 family)